MTNKQKGFTLIELMLALVFIAFVLLFIISSIVQVARIYNKGMSMGQISRTGQQVLMDMGREMRYYRPTYIATANRLCVGGLSYAWNVPGNSPNNYTSGSTEAIRLVSVRDINSTLCTPVSGSYPDINPAQATDILGRDIVPLEFEIVENGKLRDIRLVLSTASSGGANTAVPNGSGGYVCADNNEFCAFADFTTSIYSRGE